MCRRISKAEWETKGGLRNSNLYRVQKGGRWYYYEGAKE